MKIGFVKIGVLVLCLLSVMPNRAYGSSREKESALQNASKPDRAKLSSVLPKFEQYAEKTRKDWKVPGMAVAIVVNDEMVYAKGFGVKQVGGTEAIDPHTIFQIGSTSKAFTTALVAMQVDAKKFQWSDRVVEHLPDFMMADPWATREFQVPDLMAQHSGMAAYAGDTQAFLGFDRQHIIHSLRYLQPVSSFRTQFAYVNNLFLVAAALVEKYTGASWETNIEQRIFNPLGMKESTATLQGFLEATNLAIPHASQDQALVPLGKDWQFQDWVYTYGPAGGINSNVVDMAKWLRLHLGRGTFEGKSLIGADNINFLHSPKTIIVSGDPAQQFGQDHPLWGRGAYYAQGWIYAYSDPYPIVWHNGGTSGCKTVVAFVPEANIGIVVLSNFAETEVPEILAQWFFDHYLGVSNKDWNQIVLDRTKKATAENDAKTLNPSEKVSPALPLAAYSGVYRNDIYGDAIVASENGMLTLTIGPKKLKTRLQHRDRDTFIWTLLPDLDSPVQFDIVAGRAETLTLEFLSKEGAGGFRRIDRKK